MPVKYTWKDKVDYIDHYRRGEIRERKVVLIGRTVEFEDKLLNDIVSASVSDHNRQPAGKSDPKWVGHISWFDFSNPWIYGDDYNTYDYYYEKNNKSYDREYFSTIEEAQEELEAELQTALGLMMYHIGKLYRKVGKVLDKK